MRAAKAGRAVWSVDKGKHQRSLAGAGPDVAKSRRADERLLGFFLWLEFRGVLPGFSSRKNESRERSSERRR